MGEDALDLGLQALQIGEVHDAHGAPADLVLVGRADAALGRADLAGAGGRLAQCVELAVERQDQCRVLGDAQVLAGDRDPERLDARDLVNQGPRIDHDAVADHRELSLAHDTGRQQRELIGRAVDHQRMAGVMAPLEAHHHVGALGQPIDDLALALVAPLGADDHDIGHDEIL